MWKNEALDENRALIDFERNRVLSYTKQIACSYILKSIKKEGTSLGAREGKLQENVRM